MTSDTFVVRPCSADDQEWVSEITIEYWGADFIIVHDTIFYPAQLPGFVAQEEERKLGLLTYHIQADQCEIVTLNSLEPFLGVGGALVEAVKGEATRFGCRRLWVITTNDNLDSLRFYQKRGFLLVAVHRGAVERSRRYKPISKIGNYGIPIRDEIELEMILN